MYCTWCSYNVSVVSARGKALPAIVMGFAWYNAVSSIIIILLPFQRTAALSFFVDCVPAKPFIMSFKIYTKGK